MDRRRRLMTHLQRQSIPGPNDCNTFTVHPGKPPLPCPLLHPWRRGGRTFSQALCPRRSTSTRGPTTFSLAPRGTSGERDRGRGATRQYQQSYTSTAMTAAKVQLLEPPQQSWGISYWIIRVRESSTTLLRHQRGIATRFVTCHTATHKESARGLAQSPPTPKLRWAGKT